ncbi:MAG: DUF11 domain-containing protein [bacterium]|nr:DUF11 domain-containing protein [bacterium]
MKRLSPSAAAGFRIASRRAAISSTFLIGATVSIALAAGPAFAGIGSSTTTVDPQSALFSASAQSVTLSATVGGTGGCDPDGGTVTFQVKDGMMDVGSAVVDMSVTAGAASVSYTLPAATAVGSYSIEASFSDGEFQCQDSMGTNTLTIDPSSSVAFSKGFFPDTIGPGSTTTLTFDISNIESPALVTDIAFTDVLPAGITIATPSSAFTDCTNAILSAPDGGGTITLSGGQLGADEACSVTVNVVGASTATNTSGDLTSSAGNSGTAVATLTVDTARPGFSKAFFPASISLGGTSTLSLTISSASGATSLEFIDPLPTGMTVVTPPNVSNTCGGTVSFGETGDRFSLSGGSVGAESSCTVSVDVTTGTTGSFVNTTGELVSSGAEISSGFATATLDVPVEFLVKSFIDDPVPPGGTVTLQFTVTNLDRDFPATDIAFDDTIDPLGSLTGLSPGETLPKPVCNGGSLDFSVDTLSLTGGSLGAGDSCTFSVLLDVPAAAAAGTFTNVTDPITAMIDGDGVVGNTATDDLVVSLAPTFTKEFIDDPAAAGGSVTLRFTITNVNPASELTDIEFDDDVDGVQGDTVLYPNGLFGLAANSLVMGDTDDPILDVCGEGSQITVFNPPDIMIGMIVIVTPPDPSLLEFSGGSLEAAGMPGDSCSFDVTLDIPPGTPSGVYTNTTGDLTGSFGIEGIEGFVTSPPTSGDLIVVGAPALTKEFLDDPVAPGGTVTLELTLSHDAAATGDATGVTFSDDLAAALLGLTATGLPKSDLCGPGNGSLTGSAMDTFLDVSGVDLEPGETCSFDVTLDVPAPAAAGPHTNTTSSVVATVEGLPGVIGNAAEDDLLIAGLTLTKEFLDDPVIPGDPVTLEFVIENVSPTDTATSITIRDDLDLILGFSSPSITGDGMTVTDVCGPGNGTVAWTVGDTFMTFSGGTLVPGEMCDFSVVLDVPAAAASGTYVNTTGDDSGPGFTALMPTLIAFEEATDDLIVSSELLFLTKEFTDDPAAPGGTVTLELTLTNLADEAVFEIELSDDLEAALAGLTALGLPISACGGTVSTPDLGSTIELTGGSLAAAGAAGDSCSFSVTLLVPTDVLLGTTAVNTTSEVIGLLPDELEVTGDPATDELQISNLSFTKEFDGPAPAGGTVLLTFQVENLDASEGVSGIEFSDDLDLTVAGLEAIGLPVFDVCGDGSVVDGTSVVSLGGGSLNPGGSCTFSVTVQVPMTAAPGTYTNTTGTLFVDSAPVGLPAVADLEVFSDAAIEITKTPSATPVPASAVVTFTIALRNLGSVDLTNVAVSDPLTPSCDRAAGDLPMLIPGGVTSYDCDTPPLFADLDNVATVTADVPAGPPVEASATGSVVVLDPVVTIEKSPAEQTILAGEIATFEITVTNVGDVGLTDLSVLDLETPDCARDGSEGSEDLPNLLPGQSISYFCDTEPLGVDLVNVATVEATTQNGLPVTATDSAAVEVILPIEIVKSPSEQTLAAGDTATFTITLENPGTVEKTDVVVSDPLTPDCDTTLPTLAAGGTVSYTCTTDPLFADLTNVATVTAESPAGTVEANSTAFVDVIDATVEITKTPDVQFVAPGGMATFTVTVTNPGPDELTGIDVTDPLTPDCDFTVPSLGASESESKVCTTGPLTEDFTNVATVEATSVVGLIEASASADVNVRNPIEIVKSPAEQTIPSGTAATFTITLINDGDEPLTDVAVSDPLTPDCDRAAGSLGDLAAGGGTISYSCATDTLSADLINEATVTAEGSEGTVTATDSALVDVLTDLEITKTPGTQTIEAGDSASFTIMVTNSGEEVVAAVTVADPATPECDADLGSLAPDESVSYDCTSQPLFFDLTNVATASGTVVDGEVSAVATAEVTVLQQLVITKDPPEQEIQAGETAEFTITVSNPSAVTRTDVAVSDTLTPSCDRDVGVLGDLAPGEETSYTCETDPLFSDLTNVATATAEGPTGTVSTVDTAFVRVLDPVIEITKTPAIQAVDPGDAATFTITLTNPGPGVLSDLSVSDPLTPDCDRAVGELPDLTADTFTSYGCTTGPLSEDFTNVATVTAISETLLEVEASASAEVNVRNPIEIVKSPLEQQVFVGETASFTITLINDGEALKTDVAVSDPLSPDCDRAVGELPDLQPNGGRFSYDCESDPLFADLTNVATVTADSTEGPVEASASAFVQVIEESLPEVVEVATADGPLAVCDTVRTRVRSLQLRIEGGERPFAGADDTAGYLVVGAGPDGDFSTVACGGATGDDIPIEIVALQLTSVDPSTLDVALSLGQPLDGLVRLLVCDTITDANDNALDGDGDGNAGGDFVLPFFRADPFNRFDNGHFDDCPVTLDPWVTVVTPPNDLLPGTPGTDDSESSQLSASARASHVSAEPSALAQCVPVEGGAAEELRARVRFEPQLGAVARFEETCEFFAGPACTGADLGSVSIASVLEDEGGTWLFLTDGLTVPGGAASVLCDFTIEAVGPGADFDAFLDGLFLGPGEQIFTDGFESGDVAAWSSSVP